MRKLLISVVILVVVAAGVLLALPYVLDVNKYRGRIQSELEKRTGRPVTLGQMRLKVFPLAFRVENAVIGEDPSVRSTLPFAQVSELLVSAQLMPLLQGDVQVNSVQLNKPRIELVKLANGAWNFSTLGRNTAPAAAPKGPATPAPAQPTPPQPAPGQRQFSLAQLAIVDGQVALTDLQKQQPRAVYDHIDLDLKDLAPGRPASIALAAHLPGTGKELIELKGKGGPLQDNVAATDFTGEIKLDGVSFAGLAKFLNSAALEGMDFIASGQAQISNHAGKASSKGDLKLEDGRVKGVVIGYPITADYDVTADLKQDSLRIEKGQLKLGPTPVAISGTMHTGSTPAAIDLQVKATNASISELARLASAFGVAFNPGTEIKGAIDANVAARGTTKDPVLNGTLDAREITISGKALHQPVQVTNVHLALAPNAVRSNEFVASTGGTAVKVAFTLLDYSTPRSAIDASIATQNAQVNELLTIGQAYGVKALEGMSGSGPISLSLRAQGPVKDPNAMQYSGQGKLQNASLTMPSITKPIQVKNADLRFSQNAAVLENLAATVGATNASGRLTLRGLAPGAAPVAEFDLAADKIDVAEWQQLMPTSTAAAPAPKAATFSLIPAAHAETKTAAEPSLIQRLTGNGTLNVGTLIYDQLQLSSVRTPVKLDHGLITLAPISAQIYGGSTGGSIVADTRPATPIYTVSTKLDRVDANKLISSVSNLKQVLFGLLAANANVGFVSSASDATQTAKTLNGKISLNLQNGKLGGIDLLNQLASIGKFVGFNKAQEPFTNIAKLTGDFDVRNGVATTNNLAAAIDGGSLAATGSVNLAAQSLDMAVTAVLAKDYAQQVGGTNIGGYLTTALANSKGELVMPVQISGTFSAPKVVPDYKKLAQMKLENLLPSAGNPGGLTTGVLDAVLGKKNQGQAPTENGTSPTKPTNPVQGILDALGGKKAQPQQQPQQQQNTVEGDRLPDPTQPKGTQPPPKQEPPKQEDPLPDPNKPK